MDGRIDGWTEGHTEFAPRVLQDISPLGPLPKKGWKEGRKERKQDGENDGKKENRMERGPERKKAGLKERR